MTNAARRRRRGAVKREALAGRCAAAGGRGPRALPTARPAGRSFAARGRRPTGLGRSRAVLLTRRDEVADDGLRDGVPPTWRYGAITFWFRLVFVCF